MSISYEPIPIDSGDENEHVAENTRMIEDDAREERSRSTDRYHFFQGGPEDSDEDPEENPPEANHQTPVPAANSETRPPARRTPRIRITMPRPPQETQSRPPTPPSNPYARTGFQAWERTLRTLRRWREGRQYTSVPQGEASSSVRQEFLLDTTPIVVDKIARHEERLDMIEDIVMDLPGSDQFGELQDQANNADENIAYVNNNVQSLKAQMEAMKWDFKNMESTREKWERQIHECHTMTAMALGTTQDNVKDFFKNSGK